MIGSKQIQAQAFGQTERNKLWDIFVWPQEFYYDRLGTTSGLKEKNVGEFGDVSDRKELRASLECRDFSWYLSHQMPGLAGDQAAVLGAGEIKNPHHQFCLDQQDNEHNTGLPVLVFDCHGLKGNQYWYYRADMTITRDTLCIGKKRAGSKNSNYVELVPCDGSDRWEYDPRSGLLRHQQAELCLKVTRSPLKLWLKPCSNQDTEQKWYFTHYDDQGLFVTKKDSDVVEDEDVSQKIEL